MKKIPNSNCGQSLIEILIGITIVAAFLIGGVLVIVNVFRLGKTNLNTQTAQDLSSELLNDVRSINTANWQNLYGLSPKGSSTLYHVATSTSGFQVVSGSESLTIDSVIYTRYFYVEDVCRDNSGGTGGTGNIITVSNTSTCPSDSSEDPSTQKVTVQVSWPTSNGVKSLSEFMTRFENAATEQRSWSGGPVGDSITSVATTTFANSSNIDYSSSTGAIQLQNP